MTCRNCNKQARRIKVIDGIDHCAECSYMQETGGSKVDGSITRNSFRVREQQKQYAGDIQPPYIYDKATRKPKPNPDFIRLYTDRVDKTYTADELKSVGITKLKGKT